MSNQQQEKQEQGLFGDFIDMIGLAIGFLVWKGAPWTYLVMGVAAIIGSVQLENMGLRTIGIFILIVGLFWASLKIIFKGRKSRKLLEHVSESDRLLAMKIHTNWVNDRVNAGLVITDRSDKENPQFFAPSNPEFRSTNTSLEVAVLPSSRSNTAALMAAKDTLANNWFIPADQIFPRIEGVKVVFEIRLRDLQAGTRRAQLGG